MIRPLPSLMGSNIPLPASLIKLSNKSLGWVLGMLPMFEREITDFLLLSNLRKCNEAITKEFSHW